MEFCVTFLRNIFAKPFFSCVVLSNGGLFHSLIKLQFCLISELFRFIFLLWLLFFLSFLCSTPEKESIFDAQSPTELKRKSDQRPEKQMVKANNDSNKDDDDNTYADDDIKHVSGDLNADDLYALPNKRSTSKSAKSTGGGGGGADKNDECKVYEVASDDEYKDEYDNKHSSDSIEDKDANKDLPFGWEKHEDNDGPYYWHIKSGTIQREPPLFPKESATTQPCHDTKSATTTPSSGCGGVGVGGGYIGGGLNQSQSLLHMQQATSSVAKFSPHSQYHCTGMGFNGRAQVSNIHTQYTSTQCLCAANSNNHKCDYARHRKNRFQIFWFFFVSFFSFWFFVLYIKFLCITNLGTLFLVVAFAMPSIKCRCRTGNTKLISHTEQHKFSIGFGR